MTVSWPFRIRHRSPLSQRGTPSKKNQDHAGYVNAVRAAAAKAVAAGFLLQADADALIAAADASAVLNP
jgi:hypothetical protein